MPQFSTPMMKQYQKIKARYQDCLLFFRSGDFYELFFDDALTGSQVLDITLTSRPEGKDGRVPMAGVPYHAVDSYLAKLVKAGYKVAICEQLSEPNNRGIVDRDVVRVVTPGTLIDERALERKENNFLISLAFDSGTLAIASADLSTGNVQVLQTNYNDFSQALTNELAKIKPTECILPLEKYEDHALLNILKQEKALNIFPFKDWQRYCHQPKEFLKKHFELKTLASFGIENQPLAIEASAALIGYLKETQKGHLSHIKKIALNCEADYVALDKNSMINLELFSTLRDHDPQGSLLSVLDQTQTAMGGRMLRSWIAKPLTRPEKITERYDFIADLLSQPDLKLEILGNLKEIPDIERVLSRLSVGIGNARDLINLQKALTRVLWIKEKIAKLTTPLAQKTHDRISPDLAKVTILIAQTVKEEPPVSLREGGFIKEGVNPELDQLRASAGGGREWVLALEKQEREKTGITTLKVRYNKVFGFYIEVSKGSVHLVPHYYYRKQTLVNGERFITPELKEQEEKILTAEARITEIEYQLFQETLTRILGYVVQIQEASWAIAVLDCLANFAFISRKKRYVRPKIIYSGEIQIKGGRHPVVEELVEEARFVPNDVLLRQTGQQLLIITGPNMAGKSVFIRQVAIIVLMAQIGCFVPADKAYISLVDKIFVRSGASDMITSGLSTFMVEMMETAHILNHATKDSLIVMDEIGRGTSTYDGISLAWAVAEYLVKKLKTKTLFATHYHELQALENRFPTKIKNYHLAVDNSRGDPIFLHTIMPGAAAHSFGVAVAKLAGIPTEVIKKATSMLHTLEKRDEERKEIKNKQTVRKKDTPPEKELAKIDINKLTPLEALNILAKLKGKI